MNVDQSISQWISRLECGDRSAATDLWSRYFDRLVAIARARLPHGGRRAFDEEDVAASAFDSLVRGVEGGRFPELHDRDDLWRLLVVIAARKVMHRLRSDRAAKRGAGRVGGESLLSVDDPRAIQDVIGDSPTPEFAAELEEESSRLLDFLDDASLRTLAVLKMEGLTHAEIAVRMNSSLRTVERRLGLVRKLWLARADSDQSAT